MKTATFILSLFMLFKPVLPVAEYVVLYDYIKNELCINKDKPELKCNGKCHLKKEMAKASNTDSDKEKHRFSTTENHIAVYQEILFDSVVAFLPLCIQKALFSYKITYHFSFTNLVFRPPVLN